jgi:hypothetical protein
VEKHLIIILILIIVGSTVSIANGTSINDQVTGTSSAISASTNNSNSDQTQNIIVPLVNISPDQRIALAFFISFIIVLVIVYIVSVILRHARKSPPLIKIKTGFWDIIRGEDWFPSLAIFQFLIWTFVITFAFLGVYLVRIFGGVLDPPPSIPGNILALMGISVAVPIISGGISRIKYVAPATVKEPTAPLPGLSTMLEENKKPSLTRFQMFGWTWIGILIYFAILFSTVSTTVMDTKSAEICERLQPSETEFSRLHCNKLLNALTLPDIDPTLVILMGLSQGGYLGGKIITTPEMKTEKVVLGKRDNMSILSIFGKNFGTNSDTIWFDDMQIKGDSILSWNDSRIDASLGTLNLAEGTKYKIKVGKDSLLHVNEYVYKNKDFISS